jgi:hypothetical protein
MSRKSRQARRQALNERKAIAADARRQQRQRQARVILNPPTPPRRAPVEILDDLLAQRALPTSGLTQTLRELTSRADSDHITRLRDLMIATQRRVPELMTPAGLRLLWRLAEAEWVRPLADWRPRGRIATTRLRTLLRHLLLRYPAPDFLLTELADMVETPVGLDVMRRRLALLVAIGRGDALRRVQRDGLLPATLTRRMLHQLSQTPASSLVHAIRKTQAAAFDGSRALADQLIASFLGDALQGDEAFWQGVIQWLCAQHMLDPGQIRPMLDYIRHRQAQAAEAGGPAWSMKGRTADALIRDMEGWHMLLSEIRQVQAQALPASGLSGLRFTQKSQGKMEIWEVAEIRDEKVLAAEGRAMRHCVFSYRTAIRSGRCSIWSVTLCGERVLTVEVDNRFSSIVQARGRANRRPTKQEQGVLARWSTLAGLKLLPGAMS